MVPLFACTKCNSRHPFEELSQSHQLCRDCKGSFQIIKCNYCRSEFQQGSNNKSANICKKCQQLQEQHGKPGPCAYCNIIAAFIGTKCQRCTNSEKKYGSPISCEHCRQKCAFDRKDPESKKKVDGKLLCWLCTMTYKRTLAKARQKEAILKSSMVKHRRLAMGAPDSKSFASATSAPSSSNHRHKPGSSLAGNSASSNNGFAGASNVSSVPHKSNHKHSTSSSSHHRVRESSSSNSNSNPSKKSRLDLTNSTNTHITLTTDSKFIDPNATDQANLVAQLKEQVAMLNKKVQVKDRELLSKDQQIADLKSTAAREQRELREKISSMQKQHAERISEMQAKLVALQRQIASHNKAARPTSSAAGFVEPPLVI